MPRDPTEGIIRNLFRLRELENAVADEASGLLVDLFNEIAAEITRVDPVGADLEIQDRRVQALIEEIASLTGSTFDEVQAVIAERASEIGVQQAEWAGRQMQRTVGEKAFNRLGLSLGGEVVSPAQMRAIVTENPFQGATLSEWAENQTDRTLFKVRRQVQLGLSQNETLDDIVRRVRGRQAGFLRFDPDTGDFVPQGTEGAVVRPRFQGGVLSTTTHQTESIVRTAINHVAARGHEAVFSQDPEVSREYRYTAVLDSRTCLLPGSMVETEHGQTPIEEVEKGDKVQAGSGEYRSVEGTLKGKVDRVATLHLGDGRTIKCAPGHRVLTEHGRWVAVEDLEAGDELADHSTGPMPTVESVEVEGRSATIHDLQVRSEHCYVAEGVIHHNTIICASLDGQTFEYGEGPMPPQHFSCRSVIRPVVRWDNLPVDRPPGGTRQSMDGQISSKTTYEQWLSDQSEARQNEILGPSRAKLFREKDVGLDEMVKNDNTRVTVDELRGQAEG